MVSSIPTADRTQPAADVLVERDGTVGVITINRPARLNPVTPEAGDMLRSAFLSWRPTAEFALSCSPAPGGDSARAQTFPAMWAMPAKCCWKRGTLW